MLPSDRRLRSSRDFTEVLRGGLRAGRPTLTVHLIVGSADHGQTEGPARAGLVVSKAVGNSVTRHRVARRLRHVLVPHLAGLRAGSRLVIRARPGAAAATSTQLGDELGAAITAALSTSARPGTAS